MNTFRVSYVWAIILLVVFNLSCMMASCAPAHADDSLPIPVQTIIGECANCTNEGMEAVANVIRNRMSYRHQTADEVCLARLQFSFWNDRGRAKEFIKKAHESVVNRAFTAWQVSASEDITAGADHYFADYMHVAPHWSRKMTFTIQVGRHRFFRA